MLCCVQGPNPCRQSHRTLRPCDSSQCRWKESKPLGKGRNDSDTGRSLNQQGFTIVEHLSAPVILGCDFLTKHGFLLNFASGTFHAQNTSSLKGELSDPKPSKSCNMLVFDDELPQAVPCRKEGIELDMSKEFHPSLQPVLMEHKDLFKSELGQTDVAKHVIDTGDARPIKVPPHPVPFHYTDRIHKQLQEMADAGIIRPSDSPWCAPAVYVPKDNGEIRICADYVQLNNVTRGDSYPVPRAERPQQKLANKRKSAYWKFPMSEESIDKTASALDLDMGSCQCRMD